MSNINFRTISFISIFTFVLALVNVQSTIPVLAKKQTCTAAPSNIVAWWPGDTVTSANDIVGKNHGNMLGAALVPGLVGDSFGFDGVDDLVVIPYANTISTPGPFSLEFWFSPANTISPSDTLSHVFWSKGFNNSIDTANSQGIIEVRGPVPRPITTTDTWVGGSWNHVALTYDGTQYIMYINGAQQDAVASGYSLINNGDAVSLGGFLSNALSNYAGRIDELTQYSKALASSEVQQIFNAKDAGKCKVPEYRLPFVGQENITNGPGCGSEQNSTKHKGNGKEAIDYGLFFEPVYASEVGKVEFAGDAIGRNLGFGKYIKIVHINGSKSYYAHLSSVLVAVDSYVTKGQLIGVSGESGSALGSPHLHFQVNDKKEHKPVSIRTLPTTVWSPGTVDNPCNPNGPVDGEATGPGV